jgi:hypothetical protein
MSAEYNIGLPCSLIDDLASLYEAAPCASVSEEENADDEQATKAERTALREATTRAAVSALEGCAEAPTRARAEDGSDDVHVVSAGDAERDPVRRAQVPVTDSSGVSDDERAQQIVFPHDEYEPGNASPAVVAIRAAFAEVRRETVEACIAWVHRFGPHHARLMREEIDEWVAEFTSPAAKEKP